ncbi:hypothetical protein [Kutzneria kofuensis]|uniref:hypothetical protein n=1 Tax=Kutzneria kofuensis TaxID=103725 RepID=UPI0031E78EE7
MRAESRPTTVGAIALWGSSDLPGLGDQVVPRVLERELLTRLPGWRVTHYAPLGWSRPRWLTAAWSRSRWASTRPSASSRSPTRCT